MTPLSPAEVCKRLGISPSTLRKYSLQFEKHDIKFKRNHNNSRLYTDTEIVALQKAMTATKNGDKSLENAVKEAADELKGVSTITQENAVTKEVSQRHDDDATAALIEEIKGLRKEIRERDMLFVEALENMQQKLDRMEEQQQLLTSPKDDGVDTTDSIEKGVSPLNTPEDDLVKHDPIKKKGFLARLFNKD